MILVDTNLLVFASGKNLPQHPAASAWFARMLQGGSSVGIAWTSLLGFVRITTNPRIVQPALAVGEAWELAQSWLSLPRVWIPGPTDDHARVIGGLVRDISRGDDIMDAHLAALAMEHGLTVCTADRGFARFRGLRWKNPLEG